MSAVRAIQTALYGVLSGDATLTGLATVTNDVDDTTEYPYVLISNTTEKPWNGLGGVTGFNDIVRIHIYSQYEGDLEATQILDRVFALLDHQSVTVTGYGTVLCQYEGSRVLRETDADKIEIRHIPAEFRVRVRE